MRKSLRTTVGLAAAAVVTSTLSLAAPANAVATWQTEQCGQFYDLNATPNVVSKVKELDGTGVKVHYEQYTWDEKDAFYRCDVVYLEGTPKPEQTVNEFDYEITLSGDLDVADYSGENIPFTTFSLNETGEDVYAALKENRTYPLFSYIYTDPTFGELGADKAEAINRPDLADEEYQFVPEKLSYEVTADGDGPIERKIELSDAEKAKLTAKYEKLVENVSKGADKAKEKVEKDKKLKKDKKAKKVKAIKIKERQALVVLKRNYERAMAPKVVVEDGPWERTVKDFYSF